MRVALLFLFNVSICFTGFGQSGKTSYSFDLPEVGDIHYYKLDNLPDHVNPDNFGNLGAWNFTMLSAPTAHEVIFQSAGAGSFTTYFDKADIVTFDLWHNEKLYKKIGNGLYVVGEVIRSDRDPSNPLLKKYTEFKREFSTNYRMNETRSYQSKWEIVFNGEELDIKGADRYTAFKLECIEDYEERASEAGLLFLPRDRHDVLKVERRVFSTYALKKAVDSDSWVEVDLKQYAMFPVPLEVHRSKILFMDEGSRERIAVLSVDSRGDVISALFRSQKDQVRIENTAVNENFFLYPNPTFGVVRMDFVNLPSGTYFFEVYNIIGKRLWSQKYLVQGYTTIREDLGFLQKGTYIYSLIDAYGKKLFTKRMAIITP